MNTLLSIIMAFCFSQQDTTLFYAAQKIKGQKLWLKIDVARITYEIGGKDVTEVYADGVVHYKIGMNVLGRSVDATTVEDFERTAHKKQISGSVKIWRKGIPVSIAAVDLNKKDFSVQISEPSSGKTVVKFKMKDGYTAKDFEQALGYVFATTEHDVDSKTKPVKLAKGMTVAEVLRLKGAPKTQTELDEKVILTYPDVKLIFINGKLADLE